MSKTAIVSESDPALLEELVDAWTSLGGMHRIPARVDVLKMHHKKPKVFRLVGCAKGGGDVVAKRSNSATVEPILYEHVLHAVPGTLRCHGITPSGDDGCCWAFLEHVEGDPYEWAASEHRALVARWLAAVHSVTSRMPLKELLPERGTAHYRDRLRDGRYRISRALGGSRIDADGRALLTAAAGRCDSLERQWDVLAAPLEGIRPGLVHGDLVPKNVRIRRSGAGAELIVFDWETAGWGVPVADLEVFSVEGRWTEVPWIMDSPGVTTGSVNDHLRLIATVGRILRLVAAIYWESKGLYSWPDRRIQNIALYHNELGDCMRALGMEV